jgi:hypothetical protein
MERFAGSHAYCHKERETSWQTMADQPLHAAERITECCQSK